jgi:hypothetical protein
LLPGFTTRAWGAEEFQFFMCLLYMICDLITIFFCTGWACHGDAHTLLFSTPIVCFLKFI